MILPTCFYPAFSGPSLYPKAVYINPAEGWQFYHYVSPPECKESAHRITNQVHIYEHNDPIDSEIPDVVRSVIEQVFRPDNSSLNDHDDPILPEAQKLTYKDIYQLMKSGKHLEVIQALLSGSRLRSPLDNNKCKQLIAGFLSDDQIDFALMIYEKVMPQNNIQPDCQCIQMIFESCFQAGRPEKVSKLLAHLNKPKPSLKLYFLLIKKFSLHDKLDEAVNCLSLGVKMYPNAISELTVALVGQMLRSANHVSVECSAKVLNTLRIRDAKIFFKILIKELCLKDNPKTALQHFNFGVEHRVIYKSETYRTLILGLLRSKEDQTVLPALYLHRKMLKNRVKLNFQYYKDIIDVLYSRGEHDILSQLYDEAIQGGVVFREPTYFCLIRSLLPNNMKNIATIKLSTLHKQRPNIDIKEYRKLFNRMRKYRGTPKSFGLLRKWCKKQF